ncbi:hypothetical protein PV05_03067 [Exophiala xenobiotica]|uniref:Uncharacterized protein n=1 Tax=Exophiala xenobiotica TaxID=348802 RepID=A0A0D2FEP4_9EURO|nr:uncharacterized protein PV05_03067 [Exophiala xenobiotica]KIW58559.1 hypothetical protein PV05_03067 [Exophiala xenobiotica]
MDFVVPQVTIAQLQAVNHHIVVNSFLVFVTDDDIERIINFFIAFFIVFFIIFFIIFFFINTDDNIENIVFLFLLLILLLIIILVTDDYIDDVVFNNYFLATDHFINFLFFI